MRRRKLRSGNVGHPTDPTHRAAKTTTAGWCARSASTPGRAARARCHKYAGVLAGPGGHRRAGRSCVRGTGKGKDLRRARGRGTAERGCRSWRSPAGVWVHRRRGASGTSENLSEIAGRSQRLRRRRWLRREIEWRGRRTTRRRTAAGAEHPGKFTGVPCWATGRRRRCGRKARRNRTGRRIKNPRELAGSGNVCRRCP